MTTQSGRQYKLEEKMATEESVKALQEMMALLIEDRCKREDEIVAERARREEEIAAEHKHQQEELQEEQAKWEDEQKTREREVQTQMDKMRSQMERLMKVVEDLRATSAAKSVGKLSSVKLVPLLEKDDIEAYW